MPRIGIFNVSWGRLIAALRKGAARHPELMAERIARETEGDPFRLLVSVMLSARARDEITEHVARNLFRRARTPRGVLRIPSRALQKIVRPVGTYRQKAKHLRGLSRMLLDAFDGCVPDTMGDLVKLPGVGRKTASLVLVRAFDKPAICVDTHVHRLSNAFGIVQTITPAQTELALRGVLPRRYWKEWNRLLVTWGKFVCPHNSAACLDELRDSL